MLLIYVFRIYELKIASYNFNIRFDISDNSSYYISF